MITINLLFQRSLLQSIYCFREIYYNQFIVSEKLLQSIYCFRKIYYNQFIISEKFITINLLSQRNLFQSIYCFREIYNNQFIVSEKFITINLLHQRIFITVNLLFQRNLLQSIYYKQFIISELDLYVYILELTAKPEFVSDSAFITIEDANAFNLLDDFGQVSMIREILGGVLNTLDFEPVGDISPNNIHSYRATLEHIR